MLYLWLMFLCGIVFGMALMMGIYTWLRFKLTQEFGT